MKFSLLVGLLEKAGIVSDVVLSEDCDVIDLNLMDREYRDFNDNTVYFIDTAQIGPVTGIPACLLYFGPLPENARKRLRNAARIAIPSMATAFRYVKTELDSAPQAQEQYSNLVSKLVIGVDLNIILTEAFTNTGNLFVAIDLSGKILAHNTPFYLDYPLWMNSVQQGYCDEVIMDYIESRRRVLHVPQGKAPFSLYCSKLDMHILVARIIHHKETLGYFFALNRRPSFDQQTIKLLPLFAKRAKDIILRLKSSNAYSNIMQTNILLDAVSGASPAEIDLRARISGLKFQKYMRIYILRSAYTKSSDFYSSVLLPKASALFRNQPCFPWDSCLVCLVGTDLNGLIPAETTQTLTDMARNDHLLVGVSNVFSQVSQFAEYFEQAREVLKFASRPKQAEPIFYYLDYALYMMLDRIDDGKFLAQCCHPALQRLAAYDQKNGTDLLPTLSTYTMTGFNKTSTAKELYIHRNTVNYRIQQIEQLCGIDLCDERLLFTLQLSFRLFSYQQDHPHNDT